MGEYFFGITDKGKRRVKNEDTFIARELAKKQFVLACVIDGVGGYSGGEIAAAITRSVILEHMRNLPGDITNTIRNAVIAANVKIRQEKRKDHKNDQMACVLTCAVTDIKNNKLYYAHVGDTRLYLLRDHSLVKLSKDHSVVGFLEESGRLSEEDAMHHPRRNEITKALGFEEDINDMSDFIDMGESPFLPGDIILVCSDGLSDMICSDRILSILLEKNSLAERAGKLVVAANDAGGNDNITAVLVQNNKQPIPKVALKPLERKKATHIGTLPESTDLPERKLKVPVRRSRNFIALLSLFSIGLLAMVLLQKDPLVQRDKTPLKTSAKKPENKDMDMFMGRLNDSSKSYHLTANESFLKITRPLSINKDSFYIKGNGVTISCDSNYKGPAIIISNKAKHIVLDSIAFKNFDVGILVQRNNITLRNVRFINCRVPVLYELSLPDTTISGRLKDSIFIPLPTPKKH